MSNITNSFTVKRHKHVKKYLSTMFGAAGDTQMRKYISHDRLHIYVKHLKIEPEQAINAYYWNKALAGAILPAMQCLEITLRNAIDHAINNQQFIYSK